MSRRLAFPAIALVIAALAWLLEDRSFPPAPTPPPRRTTERAPDPRGFPMEMHTAGPVLSEALSVLDAVNAGLHLGVERPGGASVADPASRARALETYGTNLASAWGARVPDAEWRGEGWAARIVKAGTTPLPGERAIAKGTYGRTTGGVGSSVVDVEIRVRPAPAPR